MVEQSQRAGCCKASWAFDHAQLPLHESSRHGPGLQHKRLSTAVQCGAAHYSTSTVHCRPYGSTECCGWFCTV
jgi:hypothetical protein